MTTRATTRYVRSGDATLYALDIAPEERIDDPSALVFSHGAGGCHVNWYQQVSVFSERCRVIVWDQRGFGRSDDPGRDASPEQAADDLLAVLDSSGIEAAWVVAQSMAGWGTSLCARDHPERFHGVVLCDTSAGVLDEMTVQRLEAFVEDSAALASSGRLFSSLAVGRPWLERDQAAATALHLWSRALPPTYASAVQDLIDTRISVEHLRSIPVGVIVGESDPIFPPSTLRDAFSGVADLGLYEISASAHSPYLEAPEKFNAALSSILRAGALPVRSGQDP